MYCLLHVFGRRLDNISEFKGGTKLVVCIVFYTYSRDVWVTKFRSREVPDSPFVLCFICLRPCLGNIIEIKGGAKLGGAKLGGAKLIVCIDFYTLRQRLDTGEVSNVIELKRGAKLIVCITFCKHSGDVWVA